MIIHGHSKLVGLFGNPVSHTLSPYMMNPAFERHGLPLVYIPLPTDINQIETGIKALRAFHFVGANVTIPFKSMVIPFLDEVSELSQKTGTVNTIINQNGHLKGTTTDPEGFLKNFHQAGESFTGKNIVILGTGGTARSILYGLYMMEKPGQIYLAGRDVAKVENLAKDVKSSLNQTPIQVDLKNYSEIQKKIDIIIQATSVGMVPNPNQSLLTSDQLETGQIVYDVVYQPEETLLLTLARDKGLKTVGGLGMLVYQGIASFKYWTGIEPEATHFFTHIREALMSKDSP